MDELPTDARTVSLGRRVRWLDRYRRTVAIAAALALSPFVIFEISDLLGNDWPGAHAVMLATLLSVMSWWTIEVSLAWVTAVWETEYDQRVRDRGMPRAQVIVRK
jgi:hypothetical protein